MQGVNPALGFVRQDQRRQGSSGQCLVDSTRPGTARLAVRASVYLSQKMDSKCMLVVIVVLGSANVGH
jgi:hypothetical protein